MPRQLPAIGDDVTSLMEATDEPSIGEDVSALMGDASPSIASRLRRFFGDVGEDRVDPNAVRQAQAAMGGSPGGAAVQGVTEGALNAIPIGPLIRAGTTKIAKAPMRMAFGAQSTLRRKFPTIDLEGVALREGATISPGSITRAEGASRAANAAIGESARAADAAGAAPIQPRELTKGLRQIFEKSGQARLPERQAQVVDEAKRLKNLYRGGASVEDALIGKSERQTLGRAALQGAADPRAAATTAKIDASVAGDLATAAKARSPRVGQALKRSQELMALEKALKGVPRDLRTRGLLAGGVAGVTGVSSQDPTSGLLGGGAALALTSPRGLSTAAKYLYQYGDPAARETARAILLALGADATGEELPPEP